MLVFKHGVLAARKETLNHTLYNLLKSQGLVSLPAFIAIKTLKSSPKYLGCVLELIRSSWFSFLVFVKEEEILKLSYLVD